MSDYLRELRKLVGTRPLIVAGAAVVFQDAGGRILLQRRRDNGLWGLPAGSMEPGETLEETARREALEEVGLLAEALELTGVYSGPGMYYRYPHGDEIHNVVAVYLCHQYAGEPVADEDEVGEVAWWPLDGLPRELCPPDAVVLEDLVRRLRTEP